MNSFKKIFLSILALFFTLSTISACQDNQKTSNDTQEKQEENNEEQTTPAPEQDSELTISLNEAKNIINAALSMEEPVTLGYTQTSNSIHSNRNVLIKLGTSEFLFESESGFLINGNLKRTGNHWAKYSLNYESDGEVMNEYYDGNYVYTKSEEVYFKGEYEDSYLGMVASMLEVMYVDYLFLDSAWDNIYNNSAFKKKRDTGYTLTMDINMANYVEYASDRCEEADLSTESLFGDGTLREMNKEDGSIILVVHFNEKDKLIGIDLLIESYTVYGTLEEAVLESSTVSIKKYEGNIHAPEWFNIHDYQE